MNTKWFRENKLLEIEKKVSDALCIFCKRFSIFSDSDITKFFSILVVVAALTIPLQNVSLSSELRFNLAPPVTEIMSSGFFMFHFFLSVSNEIMVEISVLYETRIYFKVK